MFGMKNQENQEALDGLIKRVAFDMEMSEPGTEEYSDLLGQYERLSKLKVEESPKPVSRDTLYIAGANIVGILIIVIYEHAHVVTSQAFKTILKPKTN